MVDFKAHFEKYNPNHPRDSNPQKQFCWVPATQVLPKLIGYSNGDIRHENVSVIHVLACAY